MASIELLGLISDRKTGRVQFRKELSHLDSAVYEVVGMPNSIGRSILMGVSQVRGEVIGLKLIKYKN